MAGVKPPLPRIFPVFRFASALAAILFFFSFAANLSMPALATLRAAAPAPVLGMGGGGGGDATSMEAPAAAMPQAENNAAPTATAEYSFQLDAPTESAQPPAATEMAPEPAPQAKLMPSTENQQQPVQEMAPIQLPIPAALQFILLGLTVLSGAAAYFIQTRSESSWYKSRALRPNGLNARQVGILALIIVLIISLAAAIYLISTTTFYAPVSRTNSSVPVLGDKGPQFAQGPATGGDKGGSAPVGEQSFSLSPDLGYVFSAQANPEEMITVDFPANTFSSETLMTFTPGLLSQLPITDSMVVERAFTLMPADQNIEPQSVITITLDYSDEFASRVDENSLKLYWWSGDNWLEAVETCNPASIIDRQPEINRLGAPVCKLGTFILATQ